MSKRSRTSAANDVLPTPGQGADLLPGPPRVRHWLAVGLIAIVGAAAYSNTLDGPFVFDDWPSVPDNTAIRTWWPPFAGLKARPVGLYTFALNYAVHGLDVRGYHLVNLVIHLAAAMLLYGVVRRTLLRPRLALLFAEASQPLALAAALLWTVHPLQTQAVTYIAQRVESLMGLCYLATLYCFIRAQGSRRAGWWYAGSILICGLGMGVKEVMVTAPLIVLWYDWAYVARSLGELLRRRGAVHLMLAATWFVWAGASPLLARGSAAGVTSLLGLDEYTPWQYLLCQAGVLTHYLRLSFWPVGQCIDYRWAAPQSWWQVVPPGLLILGLLAVTVWLLVRRPEFSFAGGWFFVTLAPRSSIVPNPLPAVEHRMYLPLAAVAVVCVCAGYEALRWANARLPSIRRHRTLLQVGAVAAAAAALGAATYLRNRVYASELALWTDAVAKSPANARAHLNLSCALSATGRYAEAAVAAQRTIALVPRFGRAYNNLGLALLEQGKFAEAEAACRWAIELDPECAEAHLNLGKLLRASDPADAVEHLQTAARLGPRLWEAHGYLGALLGASRPEEAAAHFEQALALDPTNARLHNDYANLLARQGRFEQAIIHYQSALRLAPGERLVRENLAIVRARLASPPGP